MAHTPDVYLSLADQQGNRIIKMINYSDLHKRIKRSRGGSACTCAAYEYIYTYTRTAFLFFNLVVQLYSAAITEFVQGLRNKKMSAKLQSGNNYLPIYTCYTRNMYLAVFGSTDVTIFSMYLHTKDILC